MMGLASRCVRSCRKLSDQDMWSSSWQDTVTNVHRQYVKEMKTTGKGIWGGRVKIRLVLPQEDTLLLGFKGILNQLVGWVAIDLLSINH